MEQRSVSRRSLKALDYLNLCLADVRDGVGPYLAIYLLTTQQWDPAGIGMAMSAMGVATLLAQTPCGWLLDTCTKKRLLVSGSALLVGVSCAAMTAVSGFSFIVALQAITGIAAAIFAPAIAAITLGLVGPAMFAARMGRNEAFNHAGNVGTAALAGLAGYILGQEWIFYLVGGVAIASMFCAWRIREQDIDHDLARGAAPATGGRDEKVSAIGTLFGNRPLLIFALSTTLFHFANAAMLPLAGQLLSRSNAPEASLFMSACIITAQLVMVPAAAGAGILSDRWGRRPLLLTAFAVLPIRGLLYTVSDAPSSIVTIQLLDGIGAGIFGVLWVSVVADVMKGTGRYNLALGAIATAQGIGASLSNVAAGYVVSRWGYDAGFVALAFVATVALLSFYVAMPETKNKEAADTMGLFEEIAVPVK
jgi:MFS family permease